MAAPQPVRMRTTYKTRRRPATCTSNENRSRMPKTWCRTRSVPTKPERNEGKQPKTRTNHSLLPRHSMQNLEPCYDIPALALPPTVLLPEDCDLQTPGHYPESSSPAQSPTESESHQSPTWTPTSSPGWSPRFSPRYKNERRRHATQIARAAPNSPVRIETVCTCRQSRELHWRHTALPEGMQSPPWRNSIENEYTSVEEDIATMTPKHHSMSTSKTARTNSEMWDSDSSDDDTEPPSKIQAFALREAGFAAIEHLLYHSGGEPQSMDTRSLTRLITKKMQTRSGETWR